MHVMHGWMGMVYCIVQCRLYNYNVQLGVSSYCSTACSLWL